MKPEEVTRPVLFQVTYFWDRLMGSGMMAKLWIESPEIIDELGRLLEEIHQRAFYDGHRVGSKWTMHSKFVPSVDFDGNFYVDANVNMDRDDRNYEEAQRTADAFTQTTRNFLRFCDDGNFHSEQLVDDYTRLNELLQQGYDFVKDGKKMDGRLKYDEAIVYVAERLGINPDEIRSINRLDVSAFLLDNHALEAIIGTEVAKSRSTKALDEMEKEYDFLRNPYSREEFKVRSQFLGINDGRLHSYDDGGIVHLLGDLPTSKKYIVIARSLHDLRAGNDSVTNAYRENVYFKPQ
ncbi:MAG: hypothetical protein IH934_00830 [Nanoarchaeota archaeon]|nr:hypothetical protein [Nanoarchaeota archaeon]